ncbi:GhoT/OrtT family toxin [Escherichia coli]|nr:GhoT/OrtT family toxin [Escherichia coli]EHR8521718.1 GhoT/OrtT family toxin [Escherichia coli]EJN6478404.1 GhoT/OrtT family toxin [Escherichia coli]MCH7005840.1 GhoT/OrtT family toxin [Escherichia coli]MCH7010442.1 GhoT/OrtT family toxin [Escherichia coli]MDN2031069.1 GhoT/OrtT family toxin [Escherichia coli]
MLCFYVFCGNIKIRLLSIFLVGITGPISLPVSLLFSF